MKQNIEIDPMVRAYFEGELDADGKATVKERFANEEDFQIDYLLEEERVRRKYAKMLLAIEPQNADGPRPILR